jgi:hypothetical protein
VAIHLRLLHGSFDFARNHRRALLAGQTTVPTGTFYDFVRPGAAALFFSPSRARPFFALIRGS